MSDNKNNNPPEKGQSDIADSIIVTASEVSSIAGSVKTSKTSQHISSPAERQIKFERAQRCLENAALVSKRIKEHRKATAELLGRPFEEDDGGDTASEMASNMSEKTGYSVATDTSTTLSVQDALNIPGISESLANTLKQKELLMERIKQYKEISKRPMTKPSVQTVRRESSVDTKIEVKKPADNIDVAQLLHTIKEKDNSLSVIQVKMKAMETTILDLQEKINEKDQIIEAKNKATTLMSDNLSKKEKDSFNLLEDTRQQMTKMQENFIAMETEWKDEKQKLLKEIEVKDEKINSLEEANSILEASRLEISIAHSKLGEELESKNQEILCLQEKIESLSKISIREASLKEKDDVEEEKGSLEIAGMVELTKKVEILEQLNCQIRQTNKELENKLATVNTEHKSPTASAASKKGSPLPTRKGGRNAASKSKSPWTQLSSESLPQETDKKAAKTEITRLEMLVQSLNKDILEKEYVISQKEALIVELQSATEKIQSKVPAVTLDVGVSTDVEDNKEKETIEVQKVEESKTESTQYQSEAIKDLEEKLKLAEEQIDTLHKDMEAANLNMIKVKSVHKLKLKQLQKTIDSFSQVSDAHAEVVRVQQELQELTRKVAVLEEEKGNLQLHLVDYDSGRLTESDMYKKMRETEALSETRLKAISVLEGQKFDLVQELHMLQQKNMEMEDKIADISQLQSEHVCTEMKSVQMEEQIDELIAAKKELELVVENLKLDNEHLNESIKVLQEEKNEIAHKLENYIQENIELTDKLEKLSAEKVSSAESIEIVESLTTQEKLELEEYNKGMFEGKSDEHHDEQLEENASTQNDKNIDSLIEQREELNKKIELFTQEREEVMEKMSKIKAENDSLLAKLTELNDQSSILESNIGVLNNEKLELQNLNQDLAQQIEDLKRERLEIMKETADIAKSPSDDTTDGAHAETQHDDKTVGDKGAKGAKTVKQLTKEILKLKNTIKEREDEIADCQMKILSLEEQQQKQTESLQSNASNESKIKYLTEENYQLKQELEHAKSSIQQELQKVHQEYTTSVGSRDTRINELENVLLEYEKQLFNYGNSLQQKDKEMSEYINQVTKLNDVSQKLKSTIELLEEEKAKDQNAELVKTLNKQITAYQKKLADNDDKIKSLEEEKLQLHCLKVELTNKNINLEADLKKLKESLTEKQTLIKELQAQQQKQAEELSAKQLQTVERDEEIHEIKLQLRKESIENEKLRNSIAENEKAVEELTQQIEATKQSHQSSSDHFTALETKNRELMEKLKKAAISIKKKGVLFTELETNYNECQKQLAAKSELIDQMLIQVETLPALQEKLKHADEEINRLQSQKISIEQQRVQDLNQQQGEMKALQERFLMSSQEISQLNDALNMLHKDLQFAREEKAHLNSQIDVLNNKLVEHEIEQKNNFNLITKISSLEADINQKQIQISELLHKVEHLEQQQTQVQYGYDAKVQERDLYIENLETEITRYKNRICRLEESISIMEDRRHSLERKADQLGSQLQEKQKAYSDYTSQEDELVTRLAALMDHDRVLDKQIFVIENENKELQFKVQHLNEDNQRLKKALSDYQEQNKILHDKASKLDSIEPELIKYQTQYHDLETNFKKVTNDYQSLIVQKKQEIEELETEFNTQIGNAIKEKKILSEKFEKISEYVYQLETKLQEYKTNNETLNINITELNKINQELLEKSAHKNESATPDYTEQYINEINRLNSVVSSKSNEIYELNNKMQTLQTNNVAVVTTYDSKISELTSQLNQNQFELERLHAETHSLQQANNLLHQELSQKEEQIKELRENKTLTFEMNIPKTEGLVISSTIEPFSDGSRHVDVSSLESQILSSIEEPPIQKHHDTNKMSESLVKQSASGEAIVEPIILSKKAYVCTKEEDEDITAEIDPFNSDEGWGLGVNEDIVDVAPGTSHLHNQIEQLNKDNAALKSELQANNIKLLKALKKLKELKASNDMLTNELKTAKQMSQSAFFDSAIEDELRINIKDLEKKIEELIADINKEKRDKESLRKQNEVFHNANDRLTDMKEKLDNEVQLWKYKFQEANDKICTLQWDGDNKDVPESQQSKQSKVSNMSEDKFKEELSKIEKENEELQGMVDQMNTFNKELLSQQTALQNEIAHLNKQLQQHQQACENCNLLKKEIEELANDHDEFNKLKKEHEKLNEQLKSLEIKYRDLTESYDILSIDNEELRSKIGNEKELQQIRHLTDTCKQYKNERTALIEKNQRLEDQLFRMDQLEKEKMTLLHTNNQLDEILRKFEGERSELLNTCRRLQTEVDKLNQYAYENAQLTDRNTYLEVQLNDLTPLYSEAQAQLSRVVSELDDAKAKLLWHDEQQQASNTNSCALCNAMEEHCLQVKHNLDEANTKISQLETKNQKLEQMTDQFKENIKELTTKIENLNGENDNLLSTVAELRSSVSTAVDQRGFEIAELWKQHLSQRETDFQKIESDLRSQLTASEVKYEQLLENVQSSNQEETNKLVVMEQVNSLQNKLEDKEEHLRNLQNKYADAVNQLDLLRSEMEDEKVGHENKLLEQQEEYEKIIQELTIKNHKHTESYEDTFKNIQSELASYKTKNDELNEIIVNLKDKIEKSDVKIEDLTNQIRMNNSEIYQKTHDFTTTLSQRNEEFENVRKQLIEYEKKIEELTYEKESELAVLRLKMHENESHYKKINSEAEIEKSSLLEALNAKIIECTSLNKRTVDLNRQLEEDATKAAEMQAALENQEIEIIGLKDEIDNLQDLLRSSSGKIQKHVSFALDTKLGSDAEQAEAAMNKDLLDAVPRAELDLALYMLHQRDVRCEELTMELTQLLEERDTLQLRLSDSLRSNEEMKMKFKAGSSDDTLDSSQETISELPSYSVEREFVDIHRGQTSRSSSISDPDGEKPKLQAKLSELRSVKHSRDVRFRQESEQRQLDLRLLQRDVANLPPEAVDQLAQAHHTLSRDSQSTSTVLLNWLRGKSTPKVVHM